MIGRTLSHFLIESKIGQGGMGVVYRATDTDLGRPVALKLLPPEWSDDANRRARFLREARAAAAVTHPHIAAVYEVGEADGNVFIAMELVEGRPLRDAIGGPRAMPIDEVLRTGAQIADALGAAHGAGVVHRDLKPDNVLVGADGHIKILDFGLARLFEAAAQDSAPPGSDTETISAELTRAGQVFGTTSYMSPEQARGLEVDARGDLFSLGVVLHEMLTGQRPFRGSTTTDILTAILRDTPPPLADARDDVPAALAAIVARCLEKDPGDRYQHAHDIAGDLRALLRQSESQSVMTVGTPIDRAPGRPRPWMFAGGGLLLLTLALVALRGFLPAGSPERAEVGSLAVLPLQNLRDTDDPERFGQILQELIITDLSGVASLRVLSSQRLFDVQEQLGGAELRTIDQRLASDVARTAGAGRMLTGSLSRLGDRWIVATQLVDVEDGTVLSSERIDGDDLYVMVDELTASIRNDLGIEIAEATVQQSVRSKTTTSVDAYQRYLAGIDRLNHDDFAGAVAELEQAIAIDPAFGQAHIKLAIARWWAEEDDGAPNMGDGAPSAALEALLQSEVRLSRKERLLAEAYIPLLRQEWTAAEEPFRQLTLEYPDEKEAWYGLGEALFHAPGGEESLEAVEAFRRALELDTSFRLASLHVQRVYEAREMHDEAVRFAASMLDDNPGDPTWFDGWIEALLSRAGGDPEAIDAAVAEGLSRCATDSLRATVYLDAGWRAYREENHLKAAALFDDAMAVTPDERLPALYAGRGWAAYQLERPREARRLFMRGLELNERTIDTGLVNGLLQVHLWLGEFDQAMRQAEVYRRESESTWAWSLLPRVHMHMRRFDEANAEIESVLARFPDAADQRRILVDLAYAYRNVPDDEAARRLAERATALDAEQADDAVLRLRAVLERDAGRLEEAEALFRAARAVDPDDTNTLHGLAALDLIRGRADEAERTLREIEQLDTPGSPKTSTLRHQALALVEQGRFDEARERVERCVAMSPTRNVRALLAWILVAGDIDVERGVQEAREALAIEAPPWRDVRALPFDPPAEHALGLAAWKQGDRDAAEEWLEKAAAARPGRTLVADQLKSVRQGS